MIIEILKFIIYSSLIVVISKYVLVITLRKLAESLNLKSRTVGNIAGYATSVPEFLTIITSSIRGLSGASVYNILSSNMINFIQYYVSIVLNKNFDKIKNKAILTDIILVILTILIPIILLMLNIEIDLFVVPGFIILYFLFIYLNNNVHKLYLKKEDKKLEREIENEKRWEKGNKKKILKYSIILIFSTIILFIIGELLGNTLENLCNSFNVSQIIIGILLGFITSLPELITFFESQKYHKYSNDKMLGVVEATNNLLTSNVLNLFAIQTIGIVMIHLISF